LLSYINLHLLSIENVAGEWHMHIDCYYMVRLEGLIFSAACSAVCERLNMAFYDV